jgi:hypothetical protein
MEILIAWKAGRKKRNVTNFSVIYFFCGETEVLGNSKSIAGSEFRIDGDFS